MSTRILAIDPGLTTGACIIDASFDGFRVETVEEIPWALRFERLLALVQSIWLPQGTPTLRPVAFVIESFRLRQGRAFEQSGSSFPSCQIIGMFEFMLWNYGIYNRLTVQEPGAMSRVQILPHDLEWVSGSEHKKDAYKHARYYYATHLHTLKVKSQGD